MKIVYKESFINRLEKQLDYIAQDNPRAANKFKNDLLAKISDILKNPNAFRKSIYFNNILIRDLVFKGYTIVFRINNNIIEVFGFVNFQEFSTD